MLNQWKPLFGWAHTQNDPWYQDMNYRKEIWPYILWTQMWCLLDDVIKWKHFPCYWPFVRGIHRSPVNSPHKGQWSGALMFSLICAWRNNWAHNQDASDLRRHHAHYDITVMDFLQQRPQVVTISNGFHIYKSVLLYAVMAMGHHLFS